MSGSQGTTLFYDVFTSDYDSGSADDTAGSLKDFIAQSSDDLVDSDDELFLRVPSEDGSLPGLITISTPGNLHLI